MIESTNGIIEIDRYTSGDVLVRSALTFASENIEYADGQAAKLGRGDATNIDATRRKVCLRAIERAESQLRAAKAILGASS